MASYTLDSTIGEVLADPKAKAVLNQYVPGVADNPMVAMVKNMSLRAVLKMPQAAAMGITQVKVQQVLDEINKMV